MKLVDDARKAWKWISVQAMALAGAIQVAWLSIPEDLKVSIPAKYVTVLTLCLLVLGIAGRVVKQK